MIGMLLKNLCISLIKLLDKVKKLKKKYFNYYGYQLIVNEYGVKSS